MKFTAAAVQIAPQKGDIEFNLGQLAGATQRCAGEGADLVIFPEAALTGYFLEGGVSELSLSAEVAAQRLAEAIGTIENPTDVIFGFYESVGGHIYNSAMHLELSANEGHRIVHVYRKFFLPTYGVFDEERFVTRGRDLTAYDSRFGRFGILICEDVWHSIAPTVVALKGAQFIAVISASPARGFAGNTFANLERYRRLMCSLAEEHSLWAANAMLVGFEGGKGLSGGSVFVDPTGAIAAQGRELEEGIVLCQIDLEEVARVRASTPLLADLTSVLEDVAREITEVNDYLQK